MAVAKLWQKTLQRVWSVSGSRPTSSARPHHHHRPRDRTSWRWCSYLEQAHDVGEVHDVESIVQLVLLNQPAGHTLDTVRAAWSRLPDTQQVRG